MTADTVNTSAQHYAVLREKGTLCISFGRVYRSNENWQYSL